MSQLSDYYLLSKKESIKFPDKPGIYVFYDKFNKALYVGKAKNIKKRVSSYFRKNLLDYRTKSMVEEAASVKTIVVDNEIESFLLESRLIKKLSPLFNVKLKDSKTYPVLKINLKDKFPKVVLTRKTDDKKAMYFGPYPNVGELKSVLRIIRKIFPYQSAYHYPNKICLYNHLSLCPCPVTLDTSFKIKEYKKNIKYIILFLEGKYKKVLVDLEKERDRFSKHENFEKALEAQKKIEAIKNVTQPVNAPLEYEVNPNLREDLREKELKELRTVLSNFEIFVSKLGRIECFDISNISGQHAVGSMVVFSNGEPDKNQYRRFKIKKINGPNDPAMIKEVVSRRLKHKEWNFPDLLIVDGGKAQVSQVTKLKKESGLKIPVIGLAKRIETIVTEDFRMLNLPANSKALYLLQRIRDEAHRFAISYHKKLRSKYMQ